MHGDAKSTHTRTLRKIVDKNGEQEMQEKKNKLQYA